MGRPSSRRVSSSRAVESVEITTPKIIALGVWVVVIGLGWGQTLLQRIDLYPERLVVRAGPRRREIVFAELAQADVSDSDDRQTVVLGLAIGERLELALMPFARSDRRILADVLTRYSRAGLASAGVGRLRISVIGVVSLGSLTCSE